MKKIELNGKRGAGKHALVDDEDYARAVSVRWHLDSYGYVRYTLYLETYTQAHNAGRKNPRTQALKLHNFILNVPADEIRMVDHVDRNPLNNQKSNLRLVSNLENSQNRKSYGKSIYRGVAWKSKRERWEATGRLNGVRTYLGSFDDEYEAAMAAYLWRKQYMPFSEEQPPRQ